MTTLLLHPVETFYSGYTIYEYHQDWENIFLYSLYSYMVYDFYLIFSDVFSIIVKGVVWDAGI